MRKPSRVMIIRHLQDELWHMIEPQIESQGFISNSDREIMKVAIQRFVEYKAKSLGIEELADALDSPEQIMKLFVEHISEKGIAGDPIARD